jgi:hypothetical protein
VAVAKKAVAKKAVAKKAVAKKAVAKKAVAKKAVASFPKTPAPIIPATVELERNKSRGSNKGLLLAALVLLGLGGFWIANNQGVFSKNGNEVITEAENNVSTPQPVVTATPTPQPVATATTPPVTTPTPKPVATKTPKPVTTSITYTATGIRLGWLVKGVDVESIGISTAEDGKEFTEIQTLAGDIRFLSFTKTDTAGETKFRVTITSTSGETFSSMISLRGRFTV